MFLIIFCLCFLISCFSFSNDSGIFAMKNLELWDLNVYLMDKFCEADVGHLRIKYVNDMIFNEFNCSDVGRSKVMEYDAEVNTSCNVTCVYCSIMYSIDSWF